MSTAVLVAILAVTVVLIWAAWSLLQRIRCNIRYKGELEKRLRSISRQV
jgi:hypothetical protein